MRPQDSPAFNPIGRFNPNTQYETTPFNFKYRNYKESFSFLVPEVNHRVVQFLLNRPLRDNQADVKKWAIDFVGREWDTHRCCGFAMRVTPQQRIEIRLQFSVPWYWSEFEREICERHGITYREEGDTPSSGQEQAGPLQEHSGQPRELPTIRG